MSPSLYKVLLHWFPYLVLLAVSVDQEGISTRLLRRKKPASGKQRRWPRVAGVLEAFGSELIELAPRRADRGPYVFCSKQVFW